MRTRQPGPRILPALLRLRAQEEPDRWAYTFLEDGEREAGRLTYSELDRQARAVAAALLGSCRPGDRALLLLPPGLEFVAAFFGCLYAGVVAVPAYPPSSARRMPRLGAILQDCEPRVVLATAALPRLRAWAQADPRLARLPWIETGGLAPGSADEWRDPRPGPDIGPDDLAFLQYTSGSTSAPKGVMVSHGNLMANEALIRDACGHSRDSVFVTWLPLYHDLGLIGNVLQATYVGAPCVMMAPVAFLNRPLRWLEAVSKYRGTTSGGPNFAYDLCAARAVQGADLADLDLSSWRIAFNGAEPVRAETLARFAEAFRGHGFRPGALYPCYGLAEATLMVTGGAPEEPPAVCRFRPAELERGRAVEEASESARALVSSGRPLGGQDVRVVDLESGREAEPGRVGEIWIDGPSVAKGYWGRSEETEAAFGARLATGEGPFLRTGDLGFFHAGELFVAGRVKDLIILRGRNLYPQDLELAAERCHPGLRPGGGAAFSVDVDGEERLVLVMEAERQVRQRDAERVAEIAGAVRQAVAEEHEAQVYEVVLTGPGGVPRTTSGKVQRRACRTLYLEGALETIGRSRLDRAAVDFAVGADDSLSTSEDVEGWLRRLVAARVGAEAIDPGQPITGYGLDSLAGIEIANAVQARFGVVLPIGDLLGGMTLYEAAARILEAAGSVSPAQPERLAVPEAGEHPLSWGQRGLWFLHRMAPESPAYNLAGAATLPLPVDAAALERALQALVDRHAVLRSTWNGGAAGPVLRVSPGAPAAFSREDASGWSEDELRRALAAVAFRPFDLERGPVFRAALFDRAEGSALVLAIHHIAADFASLAVLARELGELYSRFALDPETPDTPADLPEPELRFVDFIGWEERRLAAEGERLWGYWQERLRNVPALDPAPDRPRRPGFDDGGGYVSSRMPADRLERVLALARERGCTPFMALAAAFWVLLGRRSGQEDFLLGAPASGRGSGRFAGVVGYFVNALPLRAHLSGDPTVAELLERVRRELLGAFAHELPFALITERLRPDRDPGRPQLLQAMLAYQTPPEGLEGLAGFALNEEGVELALGRLVLRSVALSNPAAQLDLLLTAARRGDGLGMMLQFSTALFDPSTAERMLGHLGCLLAGMAEDPERRIWEIPLLAPEERLQLLAGDAEAASPVAGERGLHELFEEQAVRSPGSVAVVGGTGELTYGELARRASALARRLRRMGVGPEERVAVCAPRTPRLVEALLAVLRAGGVYVPIDPAYPRERQAFLLSDSAAGVLLTETALADRLPPFGGRLVLLDAADEPEAPENPEGPEERGWVHPDQLAYLIYTSGSTGLPKGVAIRHSAAVARVAWAASAYPAGQLRGVLASTSVCFDLSVFELFVPLATGGAVVLADDALALAELPAASRVTLINTVPSAMAALARAGAVPASVRAVNLAGEPLRGELAARIYALPGVEAIHNLYGPSEDTTYSTGSLVPREADREPAIGRTLPGTRGYVLDRGLEPVPAGVPGQLWLGGAGLARGYFGRPDLTADRFRPDPLGGSPGDRLYRTGDLVRRRKDGELEFLGRIDHQVKVRGFRIELGEIEAALLGHPGVADAVVTARGEDQDRRLVGYVEGQREELAPEDLASFLADRLPGFMVPSVWMILAALPRTPNGKVDRRALPEPDAAPRSADFIAPRTALEERLAGIWAGLLGAERVGVHDNFFALGGHSLLATQVVSRLRNELGVELPLRAVFERPTVAALAAALAPALDNRPGQAPLPPVSPAAPGEPRVLSFSQERIWLLERLEAGTSAYNMPLALRLRGAFDPRAFAAAWNGVIRRHEVLRTSFPETAAGPVPAVSAAPEGPLPVVDLSGLDAESREDEARSLAAREALRPFDLRTGPVLRALLLRLATEEHRLVAALHHVAGDAWSLGILVRELNALYAAALEGRPSPLPGLPLQYADFARWQRDQLRGDALADHLLWWKERLRGMPPTLELPAARPRGPVRRGASATVRIAPDLAQRLHGLARRDGATPFMVLLAGLEAVLARYTGQTDLCIGIPVAGRNRLEAEGLLGVFLNTLPLRTDLSGDPAFGEILARVREASLEALAHQDLPFELLLEALRPERSLDRAPLFQVLFNLINVPGTRFEMPGVEVEEVELPPLEPKLDLTVYAGEAGGGFELRFHYDAALFDPAQMERMGEHLAILLSCVAEDAGRRLSQIPLPRPAIAAAQIAPSEPWAFFAPEAVESSIPERFAEVVRTHAGRPAVVDGDRTWTYAELDRVSDAGAAVLLDALGEGEGRVGLLYAQGARRIAALLAALKAGKTCVPLDPSYPRARLAFMVEDAEAGAVLTDEEHRGLARELTGDGIPVLGPVPVPGEAVRRLPTVAPGTPAYILYTSGSTGVPKGVVQSHRNVLHHIRAYTNALHLNPGDRLSLLASYAFDAAVMDVFGALLNGAALCPFDVQNEGTAGLPAWVVRQGITVFHSTPTLYRRFLDEAGGERFPGVRLVVLGGEKSVRQDFERFRRHFGPGALFVNGLGPTESTLALQLFVSAERRIGRETVPVGYPVEGTEVRLLNPAGEQAALQGIGEIAIRSRHLALGYWRRPELTGAAFLPDPEGGDRRIYRTGDLGRWLPDGSLEFVGRSDSQVKIRGQRVELGEVEGRLSGLSGVREAVVVAREEDAETRLVAYVLAPAPPAEELRRGLRAQLPDAMVPSVFVEVAEWPLTPTGKVDRAALPEPAPAAPAADAAPLTPTQELLSALFSEVLGRPAADPGADFFALGGHSLLATQLVSRVRRSFGIELPLRAVFEDSTVAALAERIEAGAGGMERPAIARLPRPLESDIPLSFAQERLWFLDRLQPGSAAYVMPAALHLSGRLDVAALRRAFGEVARRHAVLRATFAESEGVPVQSVRPPAPVPLPVVDLAALPAERRGPEASRIARAAAREPFDLAAGPLLRLRLLKLEETEHLAVLALHHIAADGWSLGVLAREVAALYQGASLSEPPIQYADFAAWQRDWLAGGVLDAQLAWWRDRLAGAPEVLELPADHPRPALPTRSGSRPFAVSADLASRLRDTARREGATPFMLLLAAFQTFLHRLTGEVDLSVGAPIAGRTRIETEGLIGLFVNTLVLRGDLAGDPPFRELLARTREAFLSAQAHQDLPFERLVEALRPERGLDRSPLFQVLFVLQNAPGEPARIPGLELRPEMLPAGGAKLDLSLSLTEGPEGLSGLIEYAADLFDAVTVARWERHLATLLGGVAERADLPLSALPLLSEEERHQLRIEWCDTAVADRRDRLCLHALLAEAAERSPGAVAVVSERGELTYGELDRWSRGLAARLRAEGIGEGSFVPLLMDSGPELVVGMLAAMRAGAAFVPLDVEWPPARLEEVLAELAGLSRGIVLVDAGSPPAPSARLALQVAPGQGAGASALPDPAGADPESPIYAIYTSGSTGRPKAAVVPHRGIVNRFLWMDRRFGSGAARRVLQTTRCVYDSVVWQIFWPLIQGGRTVLTPARLGLDPESLAGLIERHGITMADFVPSIFNAVVGRLDNGTEPVERLATLRAVVVGGEEMEVGAARAFRRLFPGVHLVNLYGPTEASIGCICHTVGDEQGGRVPIGRPISNVAPRVLDGRGGPVPVGVPGELYLAGRCVGHGYLGDEEKTRRAFVADPLDQGETARAYRTGDLVRWLPDGRIDFLGRIDHQVKIRGLRIEPGEIEAALRRHPAVAQAVVLAVGGTGDRRLVAYVVPDGRTVGGRELRAFLADRLPAAMIPASFVLLEALPLSAGGKVDRKALAALAPEPEGRGEAFVAPQSPVEEILAGIWAEVLGAGRAVGIHDDFFALGGHSLLATRVMSRVRRAFEAELPVRALFEEPTISGLARRIREQSGEGSLPPILPVPRGGGLPLSFAQQRLWFMEQLQSGGALYNLLLAARLAGPLDPDRLARAVEEVVRRHESLRTSFPEVDGQPVQSIASPGPVSLARVDLGQLPPAAREAEVARRIAAEARNPFDLGAGPLLRCGLLRLGEADHVLLLSVHHTVCDGWSIGLLERELGVAYDALSRGEPPLLPDLPVQYADYAVWQRERLSGEVLERETAWWRGRLDGVPAVVELPADRPRPPVQSFRGARLPLEVPAETADALRALGRQRGSTLFMVLLAALDTLLYRYTGEERLAVGTPTANRGAVEVEPLIGNFANTLIVPVSLEGDPGFGGLLDRTREAVLAVFAHETLPFELLVEALSPQRDLSHNPLFQVLFGLHTLPPRRGRLGDLGLAPLPVESGSARFDIALDLLDLADGPGGLRGAIEYATDLFDVATVERLRGHLEVLLAGVLADPEARLSELPLLTGPERRQLLVEGDGGPAEPVVFETLHEMVEAQARRRPDAEAVVCGAERLSYAELDRRADALALRLRALGAGPDVPIGIYLERSVDLVVAMLGVLKAGSAYVPLDPAYPTLRIAHILGSAMPPVLITRREMADGLPPHGAQAVWIGESPDEAELPASGVFRQAGAGAGNLAYVIYTSGSTGQPKGVQVNHGSVVHLMEVLRRRFGLGEGDTWTNFHSFAFDYSVWEILAALTLGGRLVVVPLDVAQEPARLRSLLQAERVTVLNQTPSALRALADHVGGELPASSLRFLGCGGEAFPADLVPRVLVWGIPVWNLYGPTEATVWASAGRVEAQTNVGTVTLGEPLPGYRLDVLDRAGQVLPVGVPGELVLGGVGVARGYFRAPELTADRFVPDGFAGVPGARVYRTGDLARRLPEGGIEFLGRIDHQVKLRGFRIELGEIEAALVAHPAVGQAVVVAQEREAGEQRLIAYVVPASSAAIPALVDLIYFAGERVPGYMIPGAFVFLDSLPLSPNGKVDRRALAGIAPAEEEPGRRDAPRTPVEELLAGIWAEVLGVGYVGRDHGFFALGGHSLLATQVVSRVRSVLGVELPLRAIFEAPTLTALAARVEATIGDVAGAPALRRVPRDGALPLSFAQERLWFIDQLQPGSAVYNIPAAFRVTGSLSPSLLGAVLTEVVRRHEVLRTRFDSVEGRPSQTIEPARPFPVPLVDLSGLPAGMKSAEMELLSGQEARRPFDLERGPMLRAVLVDLAPEEQAVLFDLHHIAGDGWSMGVLTREVVTLYRSFLEGQPSPLPDLEVQYADFAVWQREWLSGEALETQVSYWRERLAGMPTVLDLPTDRPRPPMQDVRGGRQTLRLSQELSEALKTLARREGATLFMVLLASFEVLLSRHTRQDRLVVGTPIANRNRQDTEGLIGFFVNTLALAGDLTGDPSWRELLGRVREACLGAYAHQDLPFETLVEKLEPRRDLSTTPLFQVLLVLQNTPQETLELPGVRLELLERETGTAKFDLTLTVREDAGELACSLNFKRSLFDAATVGRLLERFERLLAAVASSPDLRVQTLPLLPEAERSQLLVAWNETGTDSTRRDACLHELILEQAARTPEAVAVRCEDAALTYRGLERQSGRLARRLSDLGVGPEVRVGLFLEQSLEGVVGLLGILRAGGAYVPLDPGAPIERLASIVEDSGLSVLVSRGPAPVPGLGIVRLDDLPEGDAPESSATPANVAYVLYTSGSTGRPKGVMVEHRSVVNYALAIVEKLGMEPGASFAQVQPLTVDSCVTAIFPPLLSGGCVHVITRERALDAGALSEILGRYPPDGLKIAPSHLSALRAAAPDGPLLPRKWLVVGGESSQLAWLCRLKSESPDCAVFNHYGPTEATVGMLMYEVGERPAPGFSESAPVGRPLANCQAYLLDDGLEPSPQGALGTLHIGGDCVARGYLGRPDLTAERFVPDPFSTVPGGRLYDSGDLMRQAAEGDLVFAGRLDHQVKIRGFRIELGEIEAAVARHPEIREVVVRVWEEGPGRPGLVAYVVPRPTGAAPEVRELRRFLADKLPDYMTPSAVVALTELPRTPHGKLDLKALPAVEPVLETETADELPRSAVEELLAGIWAEILGRDRIAAADDFFAIGGHSLLATQAVARVRSAFGVDLPLRELFEAPTLEGFAARVEEALRSGAGLAVPPIVPVSRDLDLPLSFAQQRLWFLDQLDPGNPLYNIGIALRIQGPLDVQALVRSVEEIVRRHEVLRTVFRDRGGVPVQVVMPPGPLELPRVDLSALDPARRFEAPLQLAAEQARVPFDLAQGPLFRALLVELGHDGDQMEHAVLFTLHHIISDGWSMRNLVVELGALYPAFAAGAPSPLPGLAVQYADFSAWQRRWLDGEVLDAELAYWRERLAGAPPFLELPTDRPRPLAQRFHGDLVPLSFPADRELRAFARREGATLFMLILAGLQTLLCRYTGQKDLCVGTPIAGRNHHETEDLIGFFVNTLVLRADLSGGPTFRSLLRQVRETALQAHAHQDLPFEKLLEHLAPPRNLSYSPLFQVMLDLHNLPRRRLELEGLVIESLDVDTSTAKFDLTVTLSDRQDGLSGVLEYDRDLFDRPSIARLGEHLKVLLEGALADPGREIPDLPLLARSERWQALYEWNDTRREYPRAWCIQDLFEEQVARTPDATAVSFEGKPLSYRQLDERANRLAHWLLARGVATDRLVAVLVERSLEMIVALVGILKAGGAYAPLEPGMPTSRLQFLLDDVASPVLLTQRDLLPEVEAAGGFEGPVLLLDTEDLDGQPDVSPGLPSHPDQLAYVNYTSGSTGRPKGVIVPHLGVTRLVKNTDYMEMGAEDVILQLSTYAWDAATWEIWGALLNGGRLVMIPRATVLDFRRLARVLVEERITALYLTTSLFNQFVEQEGESLAGLSTLIIGGETASVPHFRRAVEMLPATRIINEYGPTENTSYSSWQLVRSTPEQGALPIGKPLANSTVYVLDRDSQPMPVGVPGELFLGGDGLARGYLGRPDLTAERFVPHPFAAGERLYRTGDLGAWRPDGTLDFLGRMDFQVKIRGHRIEPAEVEDVVKRHARVEDAVVVAYEPIPQDRRLVAYVVPRPAGESLEIRDLRAFLLETLPDYMVPSAFVLLPALPLSSTGKVDRKALPPPDGAQAGPTGYVAPRNAVEEVLAGMFRELLGVERVGMEGNFFELGGHSLLATRLVAWVQDTFGIELSLRTIFETPTVGEIAAALLAVPESRPAVERTAELLLELSAVPEDDGMTLPGRAS